MCLLPNSGSFHFTVSSAILFGLIALMLLDTSINMAMQPFKMLVGDMVNEKQKGLAYSIQSFLCNAGSVVGYIFPICLGLIGLTNTAPSGVVPPTVIWSFYIGAAILLLCVVYSLIKIKEWPPHVYNEYNGIIENAEKQKSPGVVSLLKHAPNTFWTVGLVQFFCWFAFLFLWTYATNTVAHNAFDTPTTQSVVGIKDGNKLYEAKNLLIQDTVLIVSHGHALAEGVTAGGVFYPASTVVINGNDTIVKDHQIVNNENGEAKASFSAPLNDVKSLSVNGTNIENCTNVMLNDYLSRINGPFKLTQAAIVANTAAGISVEDATSVEISNAANCSYETKTVLNSATPQYNDAGNWVGLLYAIQALGSVAWAVILPKFRSRKFSYSLSLLLAGVGFILMSFMTNQWLLFIAYLLIGCGWAAMLAWPFTILTNSLKGGNIGAYLGLFNCTICVPQIIAALAGGWILSLMSVPGELAPEWRMMFVAGIAIIVGSVCVFFIKENNSSEEKVQENPVISENI